MYSNSNKKGFSILDLIVKIIFAGLLIFILVWLFNKKVPNMKPFYSNVFRENIKYMQEAGEGYFTDDKMPTEVGESKKIALRQMIDQKLILPFVDEDGKECNLDESYVGITKLDEGYELKTNLVCPKESNYTVKLLGCHTYCLNGSCKPVPEPEPEPEKEEKTCTVPKIKQFQYKKLVEKTSSTYSCASGYTLKGKYCYKDILVDSQPAEKKTSSWRIDTVPAIGDTTTVNVDYTKTKLETKKTTNTVSVDYNVTQLTTQKTTTPDSTQQVAYPCKKTERRCTTTYQPYSYSCNCSSSVGPTGKTVTTCSTCYGSTPVESCSNVPVDSTCYRTETVPGKTTYSCPSGTEYQTGSGSSLKCYKTSCPSGTTSSGSGKSRKCYKSEVTYSCPAEATIKEGSGANLKCYKTSCPSGTTATGSGANLKCAKTTTVYRCADSTYKLEGTKCTKRIEETSISYECPSGYKLENKVCNKYKTDEKKATETKTTSSKYEYKWSAASSMKGWTKTGKTRTINGKKVCK